MRFGYGSDSRYRDAFAAATLRAGLGAALTGEARVELQAQRRAAGVELTGLLGSFAVARLALAASQGGQQPGARGKLVQAGVERSTMHGGAAIEYEHASAAFAPFGEPALADLDQRVRQRLLASAGGPLAGTLSGGISYTRQTDWGGERVTLAGVSLSMPAWQRASMNLSLNKRLDGERDLRAAFMVNLAVDQDLQLAARVDHDSVRPAALALSATRPAPAGPGLGWSLEASSLESRRARAALQYNTPFGELSGEAASNAHGDLAERIGARGTLGLLQDTPFATRPVGQGSFAVVDVAGIAGVPVMRSHQVVATTGRNGRAFVAGLLPWQANRLEIDPADLPLDATVDDLVREVTPYARSGAVVSFSVKRTRQALLVLRLPGGQPVPVGARVRLLPDGAEFVAGLRGEIWLTDLPAGPVRVKVSWPGDECTLALPPPAAADAPERIGPLTCGKDAR